MLSNTETTHYKTCPVCSGSIKMWRIKDLGDKKYNIDVCDSCGYAFVNPRPPLSFLMEYYSSSCRGHDNSSTETPSLNSVIEDGKDHLQSISDHRRVFSTIKSLSKNGHNNKFLDVGCGIGSFSKEALEAGFEVTALELSKEDREITKEMTGINPAACAFEEYECPSNSLSVVLMSQILEHALDVNLWVKKAHDMLANDGIIAIALPNYGSIFRMIMQENEPFICPPAHLNFFDPNSLSSLLHKHGFKVEAIRWVTRLPISAFEKRFPKFGKPFLPIVHAVSSVSLRAIDALHLGRMIYVYGRKMSA